MSDPSPSSPKKPYVAPQLRRVKLEPQNVVLGVCKSGTDTSGPGSGNCTNVTVCIDTGS